MSLKQLLNKRTLKRAIAGAVAVSMVVPNVAIGVQAEEGSPVNLVQFADFESVKMGMPEGWYPSVDYIQEDFEGEITAEWNLNPLSKTGAAEIVEVDGDKVLYLKRGTAEGGANNGRANVERKNPISVNKYSQYAVGAEVKAEIKPKNDWKRFFLTTDLKDSAGNELWGWANNITVLASEAIADWTSVNQVLDVKEKGKSQAATSGVKLQILEVEDGGEVWTDDFYYVPIGAENGRLKVVDNVKWYSESFDVNAGDVLVCTADMDGDGKGSIGILFADAEGNTDGTVTMVPNGQVTVPEGKGKAQVVLAQEGEGTSVNFDNVSVSVLSVEEAKAKATAVINDTYEKYAQEDYSALKWDKLTEIMNQALENIKNAETIAAVETARNDGILNMATVKNIVQENDVRQEEIGKVEARYQVYEQNKDSYSEANWQVLTDIKNKAIDDINSSDSSESAEEIKKQALIDMAAVKTELQQAQADAADKVENAFKDENYFEPERVMLADKKAGAVELFNSLVDIDVIEATVEYVMKDLETIETKSDVIARYNIELGTEKAGKKAGLQENYDAINKELYSETGKTALETILKDANKAITEVLIREEEFDGIEADARDGVKEGKLADVDSIVNNAEKAFAEVPTLAAEQEKLTEAKKKAIESINNLVDTLKEEDYPEESWTTIMDTQDEASKQINEAQSIDDVETLAGEAIETIKSIKTLLQIAKEEAIQKVNDEFGKYKESDYTKNWNTLKGYHDDAAVDTVKEDDQVVECSINKAVTVDEVNKIADDTIKAMEDVKSDSKILEDEKAAAKDDVDKAFASYDKEAYSDTNYAAITDIYTKAVADIDVITITTVDAALDEVASIKNQAVEDMKKIQNLVQEAQAAARNEVEDAFGTYKESDYSPDNWAVLTKFYNDAVGTKDEEGQLVKKGSIDKATTVEEVNTAKAEALDGMASVKPLSIELKEAIDTGKQTVEDTFAQYKNEDYEESDWADLVLTKDAALDVIAKAETVSNVEKTVETALEQMDKIPTIAKRLQDAKDEAARIINAEYANYVENKKDAYTDERFAELTAAKDASLEKINSADTKDKVEAEKTAGLEAMAAIPTILDDTIAAGVEMIEDRFTAIYIPKKSEYSDMNWNDLVDIKNTAIIAMKKADDVAIVLKTQEKAITDMAAVKTLLEEAKDAAANAVNAQYDIYKAMQYDVEGSAYTYDNWEQLTVVMNDSLQKIDDARTVEAAQQAGLAGVTAMKEIESKAATVLREKYEELSKEEYSGTNGTLLENTYKDAVKEVQEATDMTAVNDAKDKGIAAMEAIQNAKQEAEAALQLAKAINQAKKTLENDYESINAELYTKKNRDEITALKDALLEKLDKSMNLEEISQNYSEAKAELDKSAQERDERVLANGELDNAFKEYEESNYSESNWKELNDIRDEAKNAIEASETAVDADAILGYAIEAMKKIESLADDAKANAIDELDQLYNEKNLDLYSEDNQKALEAAYNAAKDSVSAATTVSAVEEELEKGKQSINEIPTMLEEAKAEAIAQIEHMFNEYPESAYQADIYSKLKETYDAGVSAIKNAEDETAVAHLLEQVLAEMEEYPTIVEIARDDAKDEVIKAYEGYNRNNYSSENWAKLGEIKKQALTDIDAADTVDNDINEENGEVVKLGINSIKENAINAMAIVEALQYSIGDVNGDGEIGDLKDAYLALKIAIGTLEGASDAQISAANVDGDLDDEGNPNVSTKDALAILQYANEIISSFNK